MAIVYLSLGSNQGDRIGYIQQATSLLGLTENISIIRTSAFYETEPEQSAINTETETETEHNTVTAAPETEPDIVAGDVDGDGEINNKDVVRLFRYVSVAEVIYDKKCDFNKDGKVNNKDVVALFRFLS